MSQASTIRNPALPFLPGFTVVDPTKQNFAKSHAFDMRKGVPVFESSAPGIGGTPLHGQERTFKGNKTRSFASTRGVVGEAEPSFIAFDRKVLRFFAYFQEGVVESRIETYRVRRVKIYYYLEDDSIQVNEEKQDNSGIPQGVLLKRHQVPKPGQPDEHYTFEDFNLDNEITFYGITYKIVDCDEFTKNFMEKAGVQLNPPAEYPVDPFSVRQAESRPHPRTTVASDPERLALRQFLNHDREVLRFFALWRNSVEPYGDDRTFVIHYFLSDDTIEVRETLPPNSGYAGFPVFVRRQRMPRVFSGLPDPRAPASQMLSDADLCVGSHVNIFNRDFFMSGYDADAFTKEHLKRKFGKTDTELAAIPLPTEEKPAPKREVPPYMGIGSEEDTMGSVTHLFPKPPKKDFQKLMANDQRVYRFMARFEDPSPQDAERRFVISAYLGDDTIAVFEPPLRNSGIIGGKFLERRRFKKAHSDEYLKPSDIYVGEVLELGGHRFRILDADDRTVHDLLAVRRGGDLQRPIADLISTFPAPPSPVPVRNRALGEPPIGDVPGTLRTIREALAKIGITPADIVRQCQVRGDDQIQVASLRRALVESGVTLTEEMILCLADEFDPTGTTFMSGQEFISAIEGKAPTPPATATDATGTADTASSPVPAVASAAPDASPVPAAPSTPERR